jgi:hypothetical protein
MTPRPKLLVWWLLWACFQGGIFAFYFFLGRPGGPATPPAEAAGSPLWMIALGPFFLSVVIRWLLLARATHPQTALVLFMLGIAFAESVCFMGLFLAPAHKLELFILSALGIFQYLPYYAGRFSDS